MNGCAFARESFNGQIRCLINRRTGKSRLGLNSIDHERGGKRRKRNAVKGLTSWLSRRGLRPCQLSVLAARCIIGHGIAYFRLLVVHCELIATMWHYCACSEMEKIKSASTRRHRRRHSGTLSCKVIRGIRAYLH